MLSRPCCQTLIPSRFLRHPLVALIQVRLMDMVGDLVSCSDPNSGVILVRPDVPDHIAHIALRREVEALMTAWVGDDSLGDLATVIQLRPHRDLDGVG